MRARSQAGLAERRAQRRIGEQRRDRSGEPPGVVRAVRADPVSPSTTISGIELTSLATTGSRASIASSSTSPNPSQRAG